MTRASFLLEIVDSTSAIWKTRSNRNSPFIGSLHHVIPTVIVTPPCGKKDDTCYEASFIIRVNFNLNFAMDAVSI